MKFLITLFALLITISINAQWNFNKTEPTGIESRSNTATGYRSIAMGSLTSASGNVSTAMGYKTTATEETSTAMGYETTASGHVSTAMGLYSVASGSYSTTMGAGTTASGNYSTAMGADSEASGIFSFAMGYEVTASDYGTFAIGTFNTDDTTPNPDSYDSANRAFVIGNGDDFDRSDAMIVLVDGTTTIAGDLTINSDARLKSNVISLGSTLNKLLSLDGKSYTLKTDESKQKIGLLAQDIQEVFPELVKEASDKQGTLSVNYQGLIPVLINAIKEQQTEIQVLKQQVKALQND